MPRADDDMSIIKASWVEAALDAHKLLNLDDTGRSYLGFDVADAGKDKCALVHRKASLLIGLMNGRREKMNCLNLQLEPITRLFD